MVNYKIKWVSAEILFLDEIFLSTSVLILRLSVLNKFGFAVVNYANDVYFITSK
jgi:hypothetical protein